jgi:hypothetical protein
VLRAKVNATVDDGRPGRHLPIGGSYDERALSPSFNACPSSLSLHALLCLWPACAALHLRAPASCCWPRSHGTHTDTDRDTGPAIARSVPRESDLLLTLTAVRHTHPYTCANRASLASPGTAPCCIVSIQITLVFKTDRIHGDLLAGRPAVMVLHLQSYSNTDTRSERAKS